jgi:arginine/lysine/ornithine decarboxylase
VLVDEPSALLTLDLAEQPELDNLQQPSGVLLEAQERAAAVFQTAHSYFLVNGSTSGILAALLAVSSQQATDPSHRYALVPRNAHQAVFHALALTGLHPVYVTPSVFDARYQVIGPVKSATIAAALDALAPQVAVVVLTSPTYHGHVADVSSIAALCRRHGTLLVVDEAHGAHLGMHPQLPPSARQLGADLVVQSTHKTLTALTQAAMLHVPTGSRLDNECVADAVRMVSSTSPNAWLLASLDATVAALEDTNWRNAWFEGACSVAQAIRRLLPVLPNDDMTRFSLLLPDHVDGLLFDHYLIEQYGIYMELAAKTHSTGIVTGANNSSHVTVLEEAFKALVEDRRLWDTRSTRDGCTLLLQDAESGFCVPERSPRDVLYQRRLWRPLGSVAGAIAAAALSPYPPGIPWVAPGERISPVAVACLLEAHRAGCAVSGLHGPELLVAVTEE